MNDYLLNYVANWLQVLDFQMNAQQLTNDDLMKHLEQQDRVLDEQTIELQKQTNVYLKKIIEQNQEIINLLKKGEEHAQ